MLKGSQLRKKTVPSAKPERRKKALKDISKEVNGDLILMDDTPFSTPSTAAWIASGVGLNGWDYWKTKDGKTLDEIFRKGK